MAANNSFSALTTTLILSLVFAVRHAFPFVSSSHHAPRAERPLYRPVALTTNGRNHRFPFARFANTNHETANLTKNTTATNATTSTATTTSTTTTMDASSSTPTNPNDLSNQPPKESDEQEELRRKYPYLHPDTFRSVMDERGFRALENQTAAASTSDSEAFVRLQDEIDLDARGITTREQILDRIKQVKLYQDRFGRTDLYKRDWVPTLGSPNDVDNDTSSISVMQFNILAEGLSSGPKSKTPFPMKGDDQRKKENDDGGFTHMPNTEVVLDFELRKWRLMEVLLEHDVDILAVEEMDRYHGFFEPLLRTLNYEGIFLPKIRSPGISLGWYSDGCSLFFRSDKFELQTSQERLVYSVGTQVLIVASLKHKESGETLVVAVTHLKARKNDQNERTRRAQVEELLETVGKFTARNPEDKPWPVLVLGDLNADPPTETTQRQSAVQLLLDYPLQSAYDLDDPSLVTTWKTREKTVHRTIDYIFYNGLECTNTLSIPHKELAAEPYKLPNLRYPSDHLMIAAKFQLPTQTDEGSR